jgi:hypothetical protein
VRKFIIHAGTHKTGTTALQEFARHNQEILSQLGLYYPRAGRVGLAHHRLAWSLTGPPKDGSQWPAGVDPVVHVWGAVLEEVRARPEQTILVSSEEFSMGGLEEVHVRRIPQLLQNFEIVPILYFRRFDEYVQAVYSTSVLLGQPLERRAFPEYFATSLSGLAYSRRITPWRSVFRDSLIVKPYYRSSLVAQSIICDFFDTFGYAIDPAAAAKHSSVNAGLAWNIVECGRILSKFVSPSTMKKFYEFSDGIYRGKSGYDLLPPSSRRQLIQQSFAFFEREFGTCTDERLWRHLRGEDLPDSDADWEAVHRGRYAFLVRTLLDILAARRLTGGRRGMLASGG